MLKRSLHQNRGEGTFAADRKKVRGTRRRVVFLLLGGAAVLGWVYVFFGSGIMDVKRVEIEGLEQLGRGEVMGEVDIFLNEHGFGPWRKNIVLIDADALADALETKLFAEHVSVDKIWPSLLRLKVEERQSSIVVIANNEFYVIDRNGIAAERITDEDAILSRISQPSSGPQNDLPILTVRENAVFAQGDPFVDRATVERWLLAFNELQEAGFGYRNAVLEHPSSTKLILNLFEPYDAYFDLLAPMPPQISAFYTFMKGKSTDITITSYVDVRVPGRVYSK